MPSTPLPATDWIPASVVTPKITWSACESKLQCATFQVPLDYANPTGPKVNIAAAKQSATDPTKRIGTLFINPGGPGNAGAAAVGRYAEALGETVRARFDIVGIDPRGVGQSEIATCPTPAKVAGPITDLPFSPAEIAGKIAEDNAIRDACRKGVPLLAHMTTADLARDMELMRRASGDPALTFFGVSYGTYLGATYAAMFPDKVRAIAVDGVVDPVAWAIGRDDSGTQVPIGGRLGAVEGASETFQAAVKACAAAGSGCPQASTIEADWALIVKRLAEGPYVTDGGEVITYATEGKAILDLLYDQVTYSTMAGSIAELAGKMRANRTGKPVPKDAGPFVPSLSGGISMMATTCSDSVNPTNPQAWPKTVESMRAANGPFADAWLWNTSLCAGWPFAANNGYRGPFDITPAHPLLVIGNTHDPATPLSGAKALASTSPGARLLTVDTFGHTSLGKSPCATAAITAYLVDGTLPAEGTVCPGTKPRW